MKKGNKQIKKTVLIIGDTSKGIYEWVQMLSGGNFTFPHLRVLFPTAPVRRYTPFGGELANVWFDREDVHPKVPEHKETLNEICDMAVNFIKEESETNKIPMNRIVLGGFSMGGALALHLGYRYLPEIAGVFALSSFLNDGTEVYDRVKQNRHPCQLFMCHGEDDKLVELKWAENTFYELKKAGVTGNFYSLSNTQHELTRSGLNKLHSWLLKVLA